jgi:hypothetical protein
METYQMPNPNSNWVEKEDGWHKTSDSETKGNADYFSKPIPPVRDTAGRPLVPNGGGRIDTARWIKEANES